MTDWRDWEREHGQDSEEDESSSNMTHMTAAAYLGDPVCTEFEKLCGVGSEILKGIQESGKKSEIYNKFSEELLSTWGLWRQRVLALNSALQSCDECDGDDVE